MRKDWENEKKEMVGMALACDSPARTAPFCAGLSSEGERDLLWDGRLVFDEVSGGNVSGQLLLPGCLVLEGPI